MKQLCKLRNSAKAAVFLLAALPMALFLASPGISAGEPANRSGKAPAQVIAKLVAGQHQDLIVVFDDKAVQKEIEELQSATALASHDRSIIEYKAARYSEHKNEVFSRFIAPELTVLKHYSHLPVSFLRIHSKEALDRLIAHSSVVGIYEDRAERKALAESLPLVAEPQAAAMGYLGAGTTVAVLDTGVDYTRPAFGSCASPGVPASCKVIYAQDFAPDDGQRDDDGHGTNVAGIVLGVAPGARIAALDVFRSDGFTYISDQISAINWVIANKSNYNIVAMNMSFGGGSYSSPLTNDARKTVLDSARAAGILTVAAAGNDANKHALSAPAAISGVVSVGAVYDSAMGPFNWGDPVRCSDLTSAADKVTCFSNSAWFLTMLAPGSQITSAGITESGTSQAAPHVAGAVAVLRAAFPNETLDQTVTRLINGVMVTDSSNDITKPRLNLRMALESSAPCTYAISSTNASYGASSTSGSITVTTGVGCSWNAAPDSSSASWITIISGSIGSGNGTVTYSIAANPNTFSRIGSVTVAGLTHTVTQSGSLGTSANILLNPDFESGPVAWTDNTANGLPVITAYLNPTSNNTWYAWLCGYNNCTDRLYQDVTIPASTQSAYVQFYYWIATEEFSTTTVYDKMDVRVYSPPSASTFTYWSLSNLNATNGWVLSPQYDVSTFKGQTIRLEFRATTDASLPTNFYLDNVKLIVNGLAPDTQPPTVPTAVTATVISSSVINVSWAPSSDNTGIAAYKIYRNGTLLGTLANVTAYSDIGLAASTTYTYRVSACDAAGNCSAQSSSALATTAPIVSDTQPPTVPIGLTAAAVTSSQINLSWSASSDNIGVTTYKIYRGGSLLVTLANVTSYSDTGLVDSTTYSYTVQACDGAGNCSAQSSAALATTSARTLVTPIGFAGGSSFQVVGNTVNIFVTQIKNYSSTYTSGSLRIELWALTAPYTGGSVTGYVTASIRTYLVSGLADYLLPNTYFTGVNLNLAYSVPPPTHSSYALFLLQYDSTNCSTTDHFCIIDWINYHETQPPTIPTGLAAVAANSSQINLSWTASSDNSGVATYKIYRGGVLVAIVGNVTSYSDTGLAASTLYNYTVAACDAAGNCSAPSTPASAMTQAPPDTQPPTVPTGLIATVVSSTQINLSWNVSTDNVGVAAYKIYSSGILVATLGNVTSTSRSNAPSTTYSYTVSACDAAGNCSAQSTPVLATTPSLPDTQAPTVPTGLVATAVSSSQIDLNWNASTDDVGVVTYRINRGGALVATVTAPTTNYSNRGLAPSTLYSYTIQACDAAGNCSALSATASAATQAPADTEAPSIPTILTATAVSSSQINLGWAASSDNVGVTGYRVFRGGLQIATLNSTTLSFSDTGLAASTAYSYTVAACDAAGNCSAQSASASATTQALPIYSLTVTNGGGGTVTSSPGGINCGATCSASFTQGTSVTLTASPSTGFSFTGWSGACTGTGSCVVTFSASANVAAAFADTQAPSVPGGVTASAVSSTQINVVWSASTDNVGVAAYKVYGGGTLLATLGTVTSYNDSGLTPSTPYSYTVAGCDAAGNCSAQSSAASATTQALPTYGLTVTNAGGGTVTSSPAGINCGATCSSAFSQGTVVTLTASPNAGFSLTGWTGACTGTGTCTVTIDAAKSVTATFADTQAPSMPTGLTASAVSSTQVTLGWNASVDNVGVTQYKVYRNSTLLATLSGAPPTRSYSDISLAASTSYSYAVQACDTAGNCSVQSASASATTLAAGSVLFNPALKRGWNLMGNSLNVTLNVESVFGNAAGPILGVTSHINSVWKWNAAIGTWQFYAPNEAGTVNQAYADANGFEVLTTIEAGTGYWVNLKPTAPAEGITLSAQIGESVTFEAANATAGTPAKIAGRNLVPGWQLVAIADVHAPREFNELISGTPQQSGTVKLSFVSLWAWDAALGAWYFYAPQFERDGGLALVKQAAEANGFLHFEDYNKTLGLGTGFWVRK